MMSDVEESSVPSLAELCARKMLDDPSIDTEEKLAVLNRLKQLSQARSDQLEKEMEDWGGSLTNKRRRRRTAEAKLAEPEEEEEEQEEGKVESKTTTWSSLEMEDEEFEREQAMKYKVAAEKARRRRVELKKLFEWKQKFTQYAHKIQVLDRERMSSLRMSKLEVEAEINELDRCEAELDRDRLREKRDIDNQLDKTKWAVQRLISTIEEMGTGDAYLQSIQSQMEQAEHAITHFKSSQRSAYEQLLQEEEQLTLELDHFKQKLEMEKQQEQEQAEIDHNIHSQKPRKTQVPLSSRSTASTEDHADLKEKIEEIDQRICDAGGSTGYWDERDHAAFLRCVSRLKLTESFLIRVSRMGHEEGPTVEKILSKVALEIPTKDEQAVLLHLHWYGEYLGRLKKKKELVQEWKAAKESSKAFRQRKSKNGNQREDQEQNDPNGSPRRPKLSKEERQRLREAREKEEQARRRSIAEWKAAKQEERRKEQAAKDAEERVERERRQKLALDRRREREQLAIYKLQKEAEQDRQRRFKDVIKRERQESEKMKSSLSLHERQKRDLEFATQRRAVIKQKENQQEDRNTRIAKLKAKPAVRPEFEKKLQQHKVTEPTKAFKSKSMTPEQLSELQEYRANTRAHDTAVPSAAAAYTASGSRSYAIGVKNMVSGRAAASWRSHR